MDNQEYDNWTDQYFREYDEPETDDFEYVTIVCPQCESFDVVRHEDYEHDWECCDCGYWFD